MLKYFRRQKWFAFAGLITVALLVTACGSSQSSAQQLYTYPNNSLVQAAAHYQRMGDHSAAGVLTRVASEPSAVWAAGQPGDIQLVRRVITAAGKAGKIPTIVAYNLPDRDSCGKFSAAYGLTSAGYKTWINNLAETLGTSSAIVIVEPDGLPDIIRGCLSPQQADQRYKLLHYAMMELGALPHARVYLDAGNPGMFQNPDFLTGPLERAGIRFGRGFSANVSNFQATKLVVSWSQELEHALGGKVGAVIDTSRNGHGPYTGTVANPNWCNPPGRALGPKPKLDPGPQGIDAYLWIKDPGDSDGPCNGGPSAGQLWSKYALTLVRGSST